MIEEDVKLKIRNVRPEMTASEQKIGDYVLTNANRVPSLSVRELAGRTGTSDATVMRFCKDLSFRGYRDFIVALSMSNAADQLNAGSGDSYTDVQPGDSIQTIRSNIFNNAVQSLNETANLLTTAALDKAVGLICGASQIHYFGIGASGIVCDDAMEKFTRIHFACFSHTERHDQLTTAAILGEGDVAVLVTYSGRTPEIIEVYEMLHAKHIPLIVFTRIGKAGLFEDADVVLNVISHEVTMRSGATCSRIAMLTANDVVFTSVVARRYNEVSGYLTTTHELIEEVRR